ncbi:hypothetical protein BDR04DRAFT_1093946 [Suillus decipiens]|nr:hypothetical protein BDR04DRAFT_1093946 [Suillus decipiens]
MQREGIVQLSISEILSKETFISIVQFRYNEICPIHHNVLPLGFRTRVSESVHPWVVPATHLSHGWMSKVRNKELTGKYQMELEQWKEEKDRAKTEKRRLAWKSQLE